MKEYWDFVVHPKTSAQAQWDVSHTVQLRIHTGQEQCKAVFFFFYSKRKAGSFLGWQLLGGILLPKLPVNEKIKLYFFIFKPDPLIPVLYFYVRLLQLLLLLKGGLVRRNEVADAEKLFFPLCFVVSCPTTLSSWTLHLPSTAQPCTALFPPVLTRPRHISPYFSAPWKSGKHIQ